MAVSRRAKDRRKGCWFPESDTVPSLLAKVALEAIRGQKTANEIAAEYGVHPTQIAQWKKQALDGRPDLFSTRALDQRKTEEELIASRYQQIGQLKVQVDWLGKKAKPLHGGETSVDGAWSSRAEHGEAVRAAWSGAIKL